MGPKAAQESEGRLPNSSAKGSVTNMISGLCDKLELESRIHLAVFAFVHGLVTKEELKIKNEIDGKN